MEVNDSHYSVQVLDSAINEDPEAPINRVADCALEAGLFQAVPRLVASA